MNNRYKEGEEIIYSIHKNGKTLDMGAAKLFYFLRRIPDRKDHIILTNEGDQIPLYIIEALEMDFDIWNYFEFAIQISVGKLLEHLSVPIYRFYNGFYEEQAEARLLDEVMASKEKRREERI